MTKRADPGACATCSLYGEKDRSQARGSTRREFVRRAPPASALECTWFNTTAGRTATADARLSVIHSSMNGGVGCTVREARS